MSLAQAAGRLEMKGFLDNRGYIGRTTPSSLPYHKPVELDSDATYLLVGSSKGLGASIVTWLVKQGARSLTFLSRSASTSAESKALFEELRALGCSVSTVAGSVGSKEDVQAAISSSGKPVKGVFQLAMVLNVKRPFLDIHSLVSVIEEPGQSNYSAGCIFLEAFCQYRHSLGLPATVLNICPVDGVGYVAESAQARWNMKTQGIYSLGEHEFLDFRRFPHPSNRTIWRRDRRMGRYHNVRSEINDRATTSDTNPLALFLDRVLGDGADHDGIVATLSDPDNIAFLAGELGRKIYELILKPVASVEEIDTRLTLAQIGLDSLMAIELRRWVRRVVGVAVSVLEIMGSGSLLQLGGLVANKLAEKSAT
ncbi:hypothetical protein C8A00DRAFT_47154 [Chaetomidium leptoderma]|uniref:Carrier domain-containing protein n=1 Tax=Chaetomidium leptoderma TaxID=669021 RepID=A0AAN6VCY9_9PEZI|nr:hypothetical protein C8A00DRAFT_47154 [Chaetomidium leptoderma]